MSSPFNDVWKRVALFETWMHFFHVFMSQCFHAHSLSIMWNISPVFKFACEAEDSNMEGKLGNNEISFRIR